MGVNIANVITSSRIVLSFFMLAIDPYSWTFVALLLLCGITDILDGWFARRYDIESEFGSKFDSFADLIMFAVLLYILVTNVAIPSIVWAMVSMILVIKMSSFAIGRKNGFLGFRHSMLNKVTGMVVFVSIPFFLYWDPFVSGVIVCTIAFIAAFDELFMNLHDARHTSVMNGN